MKTLENCAFIFGVIYLLLIVVSIVWNRSYVDSRGRSSDLSDFLSRWFWKPEKQSKLNIAIHRALTLYLRMGEPMEILPVAPDVDYSSVEPLLRVRMFNVTVTYAVTFCIFVVAYTHVGRLSLHHRTYT